MVIARRTKALIPIVVVGMMIVGCAVDDRPVQVLYTDGAIPLPDRFRAAPRDAPEDWNGPYDGSEIDRPDVPVEDKLIVLYPDGNGRVDGTNAAGVVGHWYAFADSRGDNQLPPGDCQLMGGFTDAQCSQVHNPKAGEPFTTPQIVGTVCTSGVAAMVITNPSTGMLDWDHIWGAGIGLEFNNTGTTGRDQRAYDAPARGISGVAFTVTSPPDRGSLRIQFPTTDNPLRPAYWGNPGGFGTVLNPGVNSIRWQDVFPAVFAINAPAFNPRLIVGVQFQVVSNDFVAVPYSFCISNFAMLKD